MRPSQSAIGDRRRDLSFEAIVENCGIESAAIDKLEGLGDSVCRPNHNRASIGHGLRNIDERMLAVGGHMHVISQPGCGTTLSGRVPLVRRAATTLSR